MNRSLYSLNRANLSSISKNFQRNFIFKTKPTGEKGEPLLYRHPQSVVDLLKGPLPRLGLAFVLACGVFGLGYAGYRGTHYYIEHYLQPTPSTLSPEVRNFLRGAYLREELYPDLNIAENYLKLAVETLAKEGKDKSTEPDFYRVKLKWAELLSQQKRFSESIDVYVDVYKTLMPFVEANQDTDQVLAQLEDTLLTGRKLTNLFTTIGEMDLAQQYTEMGFQLSSKNKANPSILKHFVEYRIQLGTLLAIKNKYDDAFALYLDALKDVNPSLANPGQPSTPTQTQFGCLDAIIMSHISELYYAKGNYKASSGWAWNAYHRCKDQTLLECKQCEGTVLNNLGHLAIRENDLKQAVASFQQAVTRANEAGDFNGAYKYNQNFTRYQEILRQKEEEEREAEEAKNK
jgi:tetratricopeptide (TPR) repeat protein